MIEFLGQQFSFMLIDLDAFVEYSGVLFFVFVGELMDDFLE